MKRFFNPILFFLFMGISPSLITAQIKNHREVPPPPPPPPKIDTTLFKTVSPRYQTWIGPCNELFDQTAAEKDSCEAAVMQKALASVLPEDANYHHGYIKIEYVVEKSGKLGWMRVIENTTNENDHWMNQAIVRFRENKPDWCCPPARGRAVRVRKTVRIDFPR